MEETGWLPVVEFEATEYVVDVLNRYFAQVLDPTECVSFHLDASREMVRAMTGMGWRAWTPKLDDQEGIV